ncbi:MAG: response regulator transcription factor [Planctomycetaceae bacterium]
MNTGPNVFIVDDDTAVVDSLSRLLESQAIPSESFSSAERYLERVTIDRPGCLLLDVRMPGTSGLELLEQIALRGTMRPTVVISGYADTQTVVKAIKMGAVNFLEKPVQPQVLIQTIRDALEVDRRRRAEHSESRTSSEVLKSLSDQEMQVLAYLDRGLNNRQIAKEMGLSLRTIQMRLSTLYKKLEVTTKPDAIKRYRQAGGSQPIPEEKM